MMLAKSLSDHIVLVGFGRLGLRTYHMLRRLGEDVVVIERDPANQFIEEVRRDGAPLLIGNARHEALLEDANIARARSIILATNDDLANLETALDARRLAPQIRVVLRMFDQNMADKISAGFNIHLAMSQSAISAPAFATAAIDATMISSFIVEDQLVVMQRWQVRPHGPLAGQTVGDVTRRYGVSVVEQQQQEEGRGALFPPPETVLEAGQKLVVQGTFDTLAELRRQSSELT